MPTQQRTSAASVRPDSLRTGIVLGTTELLCTVVTGGHVQDVPYLAAFPGPRVERVAPGNLVAIETDASEQYVVWRWYDAVVLGHDGELVRLWEPAHGSVLATPREARRDYVAGTRAYLSAGLPGADWWVAGPVVDHAADAEVELDEVSSLLAMIRG